jgi:ribonuclease BN (tRNA processing enzyme)
VASNLDIYPIESRNPNQLYIHFLPQFIGDNFIIQIPESSSVPVKYINVLVDCGNFDEKITNNIVENCLGIKEIHYFILTHGDYDHVRGMAKFIFNFGFTGSYRGEKVRSLVISGLATADDAKGIASSMVLKKIYLPSRPGKAFYRIFIKRLNFLQNIIKDKQFMVYPSDEKWINNAP